MPLLHTVSPVCFQWKMQTLTLSKIIETTAFGLPIGSLSLTQVTQLKDSYWNNWTHQRKTEVVAEVSDSSCCLVHLQSIKSFHASFRRYLAKTLQIIIAKVTGSCSHMPWGPPECIFRSSVIIRREYPKVWKLPRAKRGKGTQEVVFEPLSHNSISI
jgi:hypothetical protein